MEERVYRVGGIEIDTSLGCLRRDGEEVHLRPRTMQVLVHLVEQRHRLVTREELFDRFWTDTAVTDDALAQCLVDIRRALGDSFRDPHIVKTIPKVGYRFIADVVEIAAGGPAPIGERVTVEELTTTDVEIVEERSESGPAHSAVRALPAPRSRMVRGTWIAVLVATVAIAALAAARWAMVKLRSAAPVEITLAAGPGKKPIAVMYLDNQSKSQDLDWLREGLADMLIANLSRAGQLAVLSRPELHLVLRNIGHSPDRPIDLPAALEVARRSHASVVALGGFAVFGKTVRVTVQLYDVASRRLLATESATVDQAEQIPAQMDVLSVKIAADLGAVIALTGDRAPASVMTSNLEAYRDYSLAVERANAFENELAIQLLEKAIALDPGFAMAHARIGFAYAVTGFNPRRGRPYLERAFRLTERLTERDRLLINAWYAIANLDYVGAIESFRHIIANYPAETDAYLRLGLLLRGEDRPKEAIQVMERGLALDPDADEALRELGILYVESGDHARAILCLTKAVSVAPLEVVGHERLAIALRWIGRYDEAAESYRRALALNPDYDDAVLGLGNVYYGVGRYRDALAHFQHYIEAVPRRAQSVSAYRFIARIYLRLGDLDRAEHAAAEYLKHNPSGVWTMVDVALERGQLGKVDRLVKTWEKTPSANRGRGIRARERLPEFNLGMLALKTGRTDEALEHFREALRHRPALAYIEMMEDCLANAYLQLGRFDEAIAEYQRVLQINPNHALSRYHLALAYEGKAMKTEARAELERFLQIWKDADPNIPELRDAKVRGSRLRS